MGTRVRLPLRSKVPEIVLCDSLAAIMKSERLKPEEFDAHVKNGSCRLALIGMSNGGKSYRSKMLHNELGFLWYHVDEEIQKALGLASIDAIAGWIGYPTSPGYDEREQTYLELENTFTKSASMQTNGKNLVFDTTGSVAQLKQGTLDALRENTLIVHLDIGEDSLERMMERFFTEPKPVAWGEFFSMQPGESDKAALKRCYPILVKERLARYRALAHINVPAKDVYDRSGEETLGVIRCGLRA